jgi:acetoin utilization deacetylase AcuC-like enzyme
MKKVGYIFEEIYTNHKPPREHPERPERVIAIDNALQDLKDSLIKIKPRRATAKDIAMVHDIYYPQ